LKLDFLTSPPTDFSALKNETQRL